MRSQFAKGKTDSHKNSILKCLIMKILKMSFSLSIVLQLQMLELTFVLAKPWVGLIYIGSFHS